MEHEDQFQCDRVENLLYFSLCINKEISLHSDCFCKSRAWLNKLGHETCWLPYIIFLSSYNKPVIVNHLICYPSFSIDHIFFVLVIKSHISCTLNIRQTSTAWWQLYFEWWTVQNSSHIFCSFAFYVFKFLKKK